MKNIRTLKIMMGLLLLMSANISSAAIFNFNFDTLGVAPGSVVSPFSGSPSITSDGITVDITAVIVANDDMGNLASIPPELGDFSPLAATGLYVSSNSVPIDGNIGVQSGGNDGNNIDGGSVGDATDPDEGVLFSFDQIVNFDYINFDSFSGSDDFNLTVDGVLVLLDYNSSDVDVLVSNVLGQSDEFNFNGIQGTNFLFWADSDSDSFRIDRFEVSAVPVPAAAWLFGSALLGMFGFSRRKKV